MTNGFHNVGEKRNRHKFKIDITLNQRRRRFYVRRRMYHI